MDFLHLEQIRGLSDKLLVQLFAELSANEMTRNYTYTCLLVPDKCQEAHSSFGNESKARDRMRVHLTKHVEALVKLKSGKMHHGFQ